MNVITNLTTIYFKERVIVINIMKLKQHAKRLLSFLLAITMVLCSFPAHTLGGGIPDNTQDTVSDTANLNINYANDPSAGLTSTEPAPSDTGEPDTSNVDTSDNDSVQTVSREDSSTDIIGEPGNDSPVNTSNAESSDVSEDDNAFTIPDGSQTETLLEADDIDLADDVDIDEDDLPGELDLPEDELDL